MADPKPVNLTDSLRELEAIAEWFESQQEVDVEQGLVKVKQAATLIKASKARLRNIENEFTEIEREIAEEIDEPIEQHAISSDDETVNLGDIPF